MFRQETYDNNGNILSVEERPYTQEELDDFAIMERRWRDRELKETDFSQVSDSPVDSSSYATYRQELRDMPSLAGFPTTHTRPTRPS